MKLTPMEKIELERARTVPTLTKSRLAKLAGMTPQLYSYCLERDRQRKPVNRKHLKALASVLRLTMEELYG